MNGKKLRAVGLREYSRRTNKQTNLLCLVSLNKNWELKFSILCSFSFSLSEKIMAGNIFNWKDKNELLKGVVSFAGFIWSWVDQADHFQCLSLGAVCLSSWEPAAFPSSVRTGSTTVCRVSASNCLHLSWRLSFSESIPQVIMRLQKELDPQIERSDPFKWNSFSFA